MFEASLKIWILWSLGCRSEPFIMFMKGFTTTLGELKRSLTKEKGCAVTEDIFSFEMPLKRSHVKATLWDHHLH